MYQSRCFYIKDCAVVRLNDVHDHTDKGLRCEEHTIIRGNNRRKLIEKVFIDTTDDVILDFIEGAVIEDTEELTEQIIFQAGITLGRIPLSCADCSSMSSMA